jgi:DNA-binding response OmpR family regulator
VTSRSDDHPLAGLRILVVEDMLHIAWEMCDELRAAGATIVGPTGHLDLAVELASREPIDAAVLDVALAGRPAGPIAGALRQRNVPFVLVTGYAAEDLPPAMAGAPLLAKPVAYPRLIEALLDAGARREP